MRSFSLFILFILAALSFSCDATSENDYYKFIVTSMGGGCYGYYVVDDDDPVFFTAEPNDVSTFWIYTKNLSTPQSILIRAFGYEEGKLVGSEISDRTTTNISIDVYENNKRVKSSTGSKDDLIALSVEATYEFTTDDTSTTGTTDTTSTTSTTSTSK